VDFDELGNDPVINETTIDDTVIDDSAIDNSAINDSAINESAINDPVLIESSCCTVTRFEHIDADTYNIAHDDGMAMLDEYYRSSPVETVRVDAISTFDVLPNSLDDSVLQDCSLSTPQSSLPEALVHPHPPYANPTIVLPAGSPGGPNPDQIQIRESLDTANTTASEIISTREVTRGVLDESGHYLAEILKVLEDANDTSPIPDFGVPGVSQSLHVEHASRECFKIMTGLVVNCAKFNRRMAKPVLDAERDRLRESEREGLECIAKDRQQMNMTLAERTVSEMNYRNISYAAGEPTRSSKGTQCRVALNFLSFISVAASVQDILYDRSIFLNYSWCFFQYMFLEILEHFEKFLDFFSILTGIYLRRLSSLGFWLS
jgi:hypothetical protein